MNQLEIAEASPATGFHSIGSDPREPSTMPPTPADVRATRWVVEASASEAPPYVSPPPMPWPRVFPGL